MPMYVNASLNGVSQSEGTEYSARIAEKLAWLVVNWPGSSFDQLELAQLLQHTPNVGRVREIGCVDAQEAILARIL